MRKIDFKEKLLIVTFCITIAAILYWYVFGVLVIDKPLNQIFSSKPFFTIVFAVVTYWSYLDYKKGKRFAQLRLIVNTILLIALIGITVVQFFN